MKQLINMKGIRKQKANLEFSTHAESYRGNPKNTLKSRVQSMDKGWIQKSREIRNLNRSEKKYQTTI